MGRCAMIVQGALTSLWYHSYTLWLFLFSDFKTIVIPKTIFGITNAWAASKYDPHVAGALPPPQNISDSPKSIGRAVATFCGFDMFRVWEVDLASHASVLAFGERISKLPQLDVAILNAAVATAQFSTAEGYEQTLTVNVINTLFLSLLILPTLKATRTKNPSRTPRLTFVVSEVHAWVDFPEWKEDQPMEFVSDQTKAKMDERYPLSKLLEVLLVQELAGRVRGSEVVINMINPGFCHSQLGREAGLKFKLMKMVLARSTEVGSRTLVAGGAAGLESHGSYMTDGHVENTALSPFVRSEEGRQAREKLWAELSSILEGVHPGIMQNV
ncbi:hypothetical protein DTO012A8_9924 [Penicillium roqueforti]|nr:hypothetical protein DTO012A8_9924 [Penicillium roqueforti]